MNYYKEIKNELINNEVYKRVKDYSKNRNELSTYYNVGKLLIEAQGGEDRARYGDGLIKEYSERLTKELGKGYSTRSLKNMRKFYLIYQKGQAMPAQLTWSHYCELLSLKDINEIPNIDLYILSLSKTLKITEEKKEWLKKYVPFIEEKNWIIITRELNEYSSENRDIIKAQKIKELKEQYDYSILLDDDHKILKEAQKMLDTKFSPFHISSTLI